MAEAIDVIASILESTSAFGDFVSESEKKNVRGRCRNILTLSLLTAGKAADIAADWYIVVQCLDVTATPNVKFNGS